MAAREALRALQWRKFSVGIARTLPANRFLARRFSAAGMVAGPRNWQEFQTLPPTAKAELVDDQAARPPYGSNLARPVADYGRLHLTTGTSGRRLRWLDTPDSWRWLTDEVWPALFAAIGLRADDRLLFPFSFGPFLGFWACFDAATRQGRFALAAGGLSSAARVQLIAEHGITVACCTPTYALRLAEAAAEIGVDLAASSVRAVLLAGEPGGGIPATRARIEAAWGARVFDHWGMTELGSLGIEFAATPGQLHLLEDHCIAEFLDAAGQPVAEGELGELVVTNLGRWDSPLVRYRTGDLVRWRLAAPPAGAPWPYVHLEGGIVARTDDMLWIKGNNVYPSAVEAVLRGLPWVREFRLDVSGAAAETTLRVLIEPFPELAPAAAEAAAARALHDRLYFRPAILLVPPGTLSASELKTPRIVRSP